MALITITLTIDVPDGVEVAVATSTTQTTPIPRLRDSVEELLPNNLGGMPRARWSRDEILLAEDTTMSDVEVAERINRTWGAVHTFRVNNGIVTPSRERIVDKTVERAMRKWTVAEAEILQEFAGTETRPAEVAHALGRSVKAVRAKAVSLGYITSTSEWPVGL